MRRQVIKLAMVTLPLLGACGGTLDDATDTLGDATDTEEVATARAPLTRMEISPSHVVEVFEDADEPGALMFSESGGPEDESVFRSQDGPIPLSSLYKKLLPDQAVPAEVAQATLRQAARSRLLPPQKVFAPSLTESGTPEPFAGEGLIEKEAPREVADFRTNVCRTAGEKVNGVVTVDQSICLTEKTNNYGNQINWVFAAQTQVRSYRGTITATIQHSFGGTWTVDATYSIAEGHWRGWWQYDRAKQFYLRTDITNASGDGWNFATFGALGGTFPVSQTLIDCYDGGYHCGVHGITQQ